MTLTLGVVVAIGDLIPLVGATIAAILVVAVTDFAGGTTDAIIILAATMITKDRKPPNPTRRLSPHHPNPDGRAGRRPIGAALLGILGALVAIPIAGTIQVVTNDLLHHTRHLDRHLRCRRRCRSA